VDAILAEAGRRPGRCGRRCRRTPGERTRRRV